MARQLLVYTSYPCALSAFVSTSGEPGRGIAVPGITPEESDHSFWFYGLLENRSYHYKVHLAGRPLEVVSEGDFSTPLLPDWVTRPDNLVRNPGAPDDWWVAMTINTDDHIFNLINIEVIYDREGRPRFYHAISDSADPDYSPISGLLVFQSGDLALTDHFNIYGLRPDGAQSYFIPLHIMPPYLCRTHHQFYIADENARQAVILFNELGPGLKCDLTTPTDRAVGDGIAIVNRNGYETWRWSIFDHTDAVPPEAMDPSACLQFHYGLDNYDWTHANAVVPVPGQAALLLSLRNTKRIIKIDLRTGDILWQMGPELPDFTWVDNPAVEDPWFFMQHDIQILEDGHLLLFDNGNCRFDDNCLAGPWSRALEMIVDEDAMTVTPVWEHRVPFSFARGSVERHANGNTLINNGWTGNVVEVTPDGEEIWSADFRRPKVSTTRYYQATWNYFAE